MRYVFASLRYKHHYLDKHGGKNHCDSVCKLLEYMHISHCSEIPPGLKDEYVAIPIDLMEIMES